MRPCDLRMCTSLTCLASLCTLGKGGTDFFVLPQPRHWHWYSTSVTSIERQSQFNPNSSHNWILRCRIVAWPAILTARSVYKRRLYVTVLFRDAVIDAIGHVLELPVTVVPAALVHDVLRGVRAHRSRALQLATVLVHLDRPFLPSLLLSCRQFPPLERKWFYVLRDQSCYVTRKSLQTVGKTILTCKWFDKPFQWLLSSSWKIG